VIVVDIGVRDDDVETLVKSLRAAAPEAALVALTLRGDNGMRRRAQEAGIQAFLEKNGGGGDLLLAIRQQVGTKSEAQRPRSSSQR
jgi:DNA-binding NarL/FixJ family response regulator